ARGRACPPLAVCASPIDVAVDSSGIWVVSQESASVTHLDPESVTPLAAPIPIGSRPSAIASARVSVWAASSGDGSISRIDPGGDRVVGVIDVGGAPNDLVVDGSTLWVAESGRGGSAVGQRKCQR